MTNWQELYQQAHSQGESAFYAGTPREANPHGPATGQREYWFDGWDLGKTDQEETVAHDCERAFQNGGPRVYVQDGLLAPTLTPSSNSAKRALFLADSGQLVWARRKVGRTYVWKAMQK